MLPFKIQFSIWNFKNKSVYWKKKCPAISGTCLQPACNQTVNYQLFKKVFFFHNLFLKTFYIKVHDMIGGSFKLMNVVF